MATTDAAVTAQVIPDGTGTPTSGASASGRPRRRERATVRWPMKGWSGRSDRCGPSTAASGPATPATPPWATVPAPGTTDSNPRRTAAARPASPSTGRNSVDGANIEVDGPIEATGACAGHHDEPAALVREVETTSGSASPRNARVTCQRSGAVHERSDGSLPGRRRRSTTTGRRRSTIPGGGHAATNMRTGPACTGPASSTKHLSPEGGPAGRRAGSARELGRSLPGHPPAGGREPADDRPAPVGRPPGATSARSGRG